MKTMSGVAKCSAFAFCSWLLLFRGPEISWTLEVWGLVSLVVLSIRHRWAVSCLDLYTAFWGRRRLGLAFRLFCFWICSTTLKQTERSRRECACHRLEHCPFWSRLLRMLLLFRIQWRRTAGFAQSASLWSHRTFWSSHRLRRLSLGPFLWWLNSVYRQRVRSLVAWDLRLADHSGFLGL